MLCQSSSLTHFFLSEPGADSVRFHMFADFSEYFLIKAGKKKRGVFVKTVNTEYRLCHSTTFEYF